MSEATAARQAPYLLFSLLLSVATIATLWIASVRDLAPEIRQVLQYADWAVCALFFVDFLVQVARAENRGQYLLRWGWLDLLSCIPIVDALRWTRIARVARILILLRAIRSFRVLWTFVRQQRTESSILVAAFLALVLVVFSAVAMLHLEQDPQSNIRTAADALWWSITTVTTVGYGDLYPVTTEGRLVAIVLMTGGVGLFATLSGALAAWFLRPTRRDDVAVLHEDLRALREELRLARESSRASGAVAPETGPC